jgi:hypothetical protein
MVGDSDVGVGHAYPTEDGDVTDVGRQQQIVVAVWVLGWLSGPIPAIVALLVRRGHGTYRRLLVLAVVFWTAFVAIGSALIAGAVRTSSMQPMIGWAVLVAVAAVASALAVRTAVHRITPETDRRGR